MDNKILLQSLAEAFATRTGMPKRKAETFVRAFFELAEEGLTTDSILKVKGFATFKIVTVSERESVNISTGERFQISGHEKISFLPDNAFKELVNRPFNHFTTITLDDDFDIAELDNADGIIAESTDEDGENTETIEDTMAEIGNGNDTNADGTGTPGEATAETTESHGEPTASEAQDATEETRSLTDEAERLMDEAESLQHLYIVEDNSTTPEAEDTAAPHDNGEPEEATTEESAAEAEEGTQETEESAQDAESDMADTGNATAETEESTPEAGKTEDHTECEEAPAATTAETATETQDYTEGAEDAPTQEEASPTKPDTASDHSPIIINNTLPTERHNWWRTAFTVLATLVLMTLSYFIGYYHLLCPCIITDAILTETTPDAGKAPAHTAPAAKPSAATAHSTATPATEKHDHADGGHAKDTKPAQATTDASENATVAAKPTTTTPKSTTTTAKGTDDATIGKAAANRNTTEKAEKAKADRQRAAELKAASRYPQVEGGAYLITGTIALHTIGTGDNLYKLARTHYGDKKLASYIAFHNKISNPDIIQKGQKIEIPRLTPKK